MVDISSQNNKKNVTVTSNGNTANVNATPDIARYYSDKSKEWAISNKIVDNEDYSSKYYANESKKQADISTAKATEVIESGNTAVSNIESTRDNAITDITNQENLSIDNVNTAGATQVALATEQANIATQQATIATNKTSEVMASGNEALSNIDTAKTNALTDITDLKNTSISSMDTAKNEALTEIETLHSSSVTDITSLKNTSISNITTAKDNAITSITNQETTSKNVLIDEGATQVGLIQNEGATQVANVQSTGFYMRDDKLYYINSQGEETEFKSGGSGLEVCDIGTALYVDETKGLRRYLNGQIVDINTNTQKFLDRLKQITTLYPSLLCTEEEWQTAKTMSAFGQVGKFVFNYNGADIVSVRLPRVVNVQGLFDLQNLGMTVEAGLPKITSGKIIDYIGTGGTGQLSVGSTAKAIIPNPIYGNSNTVQPEAIQYPYFIQIATGSETENNITNEIELNNPSFFGDSKYVPTKVNNLSWLKSEGQNNPKGTYPSFYNWILENVNKGTKNFKGKKLYQFKGNTTETEVYTPSCSTRNPVVGTWFYGYSPIQPYGYVTQVNSDGSIVIHDTKVNKDFTLVYKQEIITLPNLLTDYDFYIDTDNETFRLPLLDGSESVVSSKYIDLEVPANGSAVTAPANGWIWMRSDKRTSTGAYYMGLYGSVSDYASTTSADSISSDLTVTVPVNRNQKVYVYQNVKDVSDPFYFRFTYAQGNGSLYFYVGETVQNANLIDAGRIGEQLASKVDVSNTQWAINAYMPDYSAGVSIGLRLSSNPYTAPSAGIISVDNLGQNQTEIRTYLVINGIKTNLGINSASSYTTINSFIFPVNVGDVCYFSASLPVNSVYFYPLKGGN